MEVFWFIVAVLMITAKLIMMVMPIAICICVAIVIVYLINRYTNFFKF